MSAQKVNFSKLASTVEKALRDAFPGAAIDTSRGYLGRVHVVIVSPDFKGMTEKGKQDKVWRELKKRIPVDDLVGVPLVIVYGTDELH